ncbi:hypothetical protein GCM10022295_70360 [Streptomyces osmaniensis]|uniref:Uncharacterized protein n=1 Tax=Streptomyces osmaniensis TaxID=593134 RepID=A0ABP6Y9I1_9ACTN
MGVYVLVPALQGRQVHRMVALMTPDKHSVGIVVLPKRGVAEPADAERLRVILRSPSCAGGAD